MWEKDNVYFNILYVYLTPACITYFDQNMADIVNIHVCAIPIPCYYRLLENSTKFYGQESDGRSGLHTIPAVSGHVDNYAYEMI